MNLSRRTRWSMVAAAVAAVLVLAGLGVSRLRDGRELAAEPERLAAELRIEPGSRVADVGAGKGRLMLAMARRVGDQGHVFATELDAERLRVLREAVAREGLENVSVIEAGAAETGLEDGCCDAAYLRDVYHHLSDAGAIDAGLERAIVPGGRLLVIDFEPRWFLSTFYPVKNVPADRGGHGVPAEVVVREVTAAGFELERRIDDWGSGNYALVFRRPAAG